ncbi:FprA family A-type flavoprotein [Dubosiella newyorkensis]|uniref:Flavodoxin n=1 Tax=Dubosiella newyorkensis TaxID=1862672 RepID=A0A1U7NQC0_9FIRM|nr:MBL fold metallo-hydrolase [Dubosiella newyorkensis]OLU47810.1 flavodoxin [Dubosiella newyorkensis]
MWSESIKFIGANDHTLDLFENQYPLEYGVSYNSYVILDDKVAVMDTIDIRESEAWLNTLKEELNGREVDYLIVSHMEPDHAANIDTLCKLYPNMKVVGNATTFTMINNFFEIDGLEQKKHVVKEGDTLSLGKHTLQFYMAPMVHWPEVMMTYVPEEKVLFSADAFGKFGTLDVEDDWATEARRYYFNIVGKYGMQVQTALKKLSGLEINVICPLHGPILTENLGYYLNLYNTWSSYQPEEDGVLIAYATIYGHTKEAAYDLKKMIEATGQKVKILELNRVPVSVAIGEAFRYSKLVLMSSSYDAGVFPAMELFLLELSHKNFQNRKVAIVENGSWAPSAGKTIKSYVEKWKNIDLVEPVITIRSKAKKADEEKLEALAKTI